MHSIFLSPWHLYMALILIILLLAGTVAAIELFFSIFPISVTSVSDRLLTGLYRTVLLAAIVYCMTVILLPVIGGGINAL